MLPLINPSATELGGLTDNSAPSEPLSEESGGGFASLLNGTTPGEAPAAKGQGAGKELPHDGKVLPKDISDGDPLELTEEQPLDEFLVTGPELIGGPESALNDFGREVTEITLSSDARRSDSAVGQLVDRALPLGEIAEIGAILRSGRAAEINAAQLSNPSSGLVSEQRLLGRSGPGVAAENASLGLTRSGQQILPSSETLLMTPSQRQGLSVTLPGVEQPVPTSSMQWENSALSVEVGKVTSELFEGARKQLGSGIATASASPSASLPANLSISGATPMTAPSAAASTAILQIGVPMQDPAWSNVLGERVLLMTGQQLKTAEIRISPAELGPITVNLVVEDGAAELTFLAQHTLTREAIEQALPKLREMLDENGLTLGNTTVADQDMQKNGFGHEKQDPNRVGNPADEAAGVDESERTAPMRITQGLIDTFV